MSMSKYEWKKKPETVQAVRWDGFDEGGLPGWLLQAFVAPLSSVGSMRAAYPTSADAAYRGNCPALTLYTHTGAAEVLPGDYIIRGVSGDLYPCKPDTFESTYERVEIIQERG